MPRNRFFARLLPATLLALFLIPALGAAGAHETVWDGRNDRGGAVASGIYFYKMRAGDFTDTRKLVLLK